MNMRLTGRFVTPEARLYVADFMAKLKSGHPEEPEYFQAVHEVAESVAPVMLENAAYRRWNVLERMARPYRTNGFSVTWMDDKGEIRINDGWRVQQNSSLGAYKGGLRFDPTVNLSILKFLAFKQVLKNALTGKRMGGAKGGSDFDPKGKSEVEVMRFSQAFMDQLVLYIGPNTDVPAGDTGVGAREIGFMYGRYMKLRREVTGVLTGKGPGWGGSEIRPEATGFGLVYFSEDMLSTRGDSINGKDVAVSGSGNVAQYTVEKATELGGKVITMSDRDGTIVDHDGIDNKKLRWVMDLKNVRRGRIAEYEDHFRGPSVTYHAGKRPWALAKFQLAFPCATQNEIEADDAKAMLEGGCMLVSEGANMPTHPSAIELFQSANILFGPGQATNAGGVAVSAFEMAQNYSFEQWPRAEVDRRLRDIMRSIHTVCVETATEYGVPGNYVVGANIAGFLRVAEAMIALGV